MMAATVSKDKTARQTYSLARFVSRRYTHSQPLWEALLGRQLEPAAAKKLEDAFLEYRVRKSVPSWLPFLPNCNFWIPSSEETVKNLQVLAERIKVSKASRKEQTSKNNWALSQSKVGSVSKVAEWTLIQHTDKLLSSLDANESSNESIPSEILVKPPGTVIQVSVDDFEDTENPSDEDIDDTEKRKRHDT